MSVTGTHLASSNYLETASSNWFQPGRTITVMFWARPASLPPNGNYWSVVGTTNASSVSGWAISLQGGVGSSFWEMFFTNNGTNYDDFRFTNATAVGRWDHVCYVMRSDNTESGYLNAEQETLVQASNAGTYPTTASRPLRIRYGDSTGNGTFDGAVAYLRIFDGELSKPEIRCEMMSRRAMNKRLHVICDYPMEKIGTTNIVVPDLSPQGLHVTTITGTVTWYLDPLPLLVPRRASVLNVPSSAHNVAVGQVTETDTAQPITTRKTKTINQITETDLAQPVTEVKTKTINQITETDTAQSITEVKTKTINQVTEADLAQPITEVKTKTINQITETDLAQPITSPDATVVNQVSETDLAQPVTVRKTGAVNQITETDTAQIITEVKTKLINQTTETDTVTSLTRRKTRTLGQNVESDTAHGITSSGATLVNQITETNLAQPITARKTKTVGITVETDLAQLIVRIKSRVLSQTIETNTAQLIHPANIRLIQQVTETDLAQVITHPITVINPDTVIRSSDSLTTAKFGSDQTVVRLS